MVEKEWDANRELHGILLSGIDREEYQLLKRYVPNYKINLIDPRKLDGLMCFQTDLQIVFGMLKYRKSKEELLNFVEKNLKYFKNIEEDSYNAREGNCLFQRGVKKNWEEKTGGIDMCKALDDYIKGR